MKFRNIFILCFFCFFLTGCVSFQGPNIKIGSFGTTNRSSTNDKIARKPDELLSEDGGAELKTENTPPPDKKSATTDAQKAADEGKDVPPTSNAICANDGKADDNCDFPAWLNVAWSYYGIYEGKANFKKDDKFNERGENKAVLEFFKAADFDLDKISPKEGQAVGSGRTWNVAWCGAFVNWCLIKTVDPKKTKELKQTTYYKKHPGAIGANSWVGLRAGVKAYGDEVDKANPIFGAITTIRHQTGGLHVAFLVGIKEQIVSTRDKKSTKKVIRYLLLGGNQGDHVNLSYTELTDKIVGMRKPEGYTPCEKYKGLENLKDTWYTRYFPNQKTQYSRKTT